MKGVQWHPAPVELPGVCCGCRNIAVCLLLRCSHWKVACLLCRMAPSSSAVIRGGRDLVWVGSVAHTRWTSQQAFSALYGQALSANGSALCLSATRAGGVFDWVYISLGVILTELTVSQGRSLFSHLSLSTVIKRICKSLFEILTASSLRLLPVMCTPSENKLALLLPFSNILQNLTA